MWRNHCKSGLSASRAQAQGAEASEARVLFGRATAQIEALIGAGSSEKLTIQAGLRKNAVHAFKERALLTVIQRAINGRKCWTQGGLIDDDGGHSWLWLLLDTAIIDHESEA